MMQNQQNEGRESGIALKVVSVLSEFPYVWGRPSSISASTEPGSEWIVVDDRAVRAWMLCLVEARN